MGRRKNSKTSNMIAEPPKSSSESVSNEELKKVKTDFLKILRFQTKQQNNLLGAFLSDGSYQISEPRVLQELILIEKKFEEKQDNIIRASAKVDGIILNFKITTDISETYCNAKLELVEVEHGIDEDKIHLTELAYTVEMYSPKFQDNLFKIWNVFVEEEVISKNDFLFSYLHMQHEDMLFNKELFEILSQLYLVRMLKLLDNLGELGEKIKYEYKIQIEKFLKNDPSLSQNNTQMMKILNNVVIKNKGIDAILQNPEGATILKGYFEPILRIKDKTGVVEEIIKPKDNNIAPTKEKKAEKKKGSPKKESIKPFVFSWQSEKKKDGGSKGGSGITIASALEKSNFSGNVKKSDILKRLDRINQIPTPHMRPIKVSDKEKTVQPTKPVPKIEEKAITAKLERIIRDFEKMSNDEKSKPIKLNSPPENRIEYTIASTVSEQLSEIKINSAPPETNTDKLEKTIKETEERSVVKTHNLFEEQTKENQL